MIQLSVTNSGTLGIITLQGRLSEQHAVELREHLLRGIARATRIIVNCGSVTSIDPACIRLLCTAYRVSLAQNKEFTLAGDRSTLFRRTSGKGLAPHCDKSDHQCAGGCLWTNNGPAEQYPAGTGTEQDVAA